ncbi:MAG: amidophosphoribosyltransferase [Oscillospiraceae bacterium]|jgi:amidophosphoribosyltransferase|nr:amidophosphoribosyltransferase [Oscillospiraceae bacterium]
MDKLIEECGIVAVAQNRGIEAAQKAFFGLNGLQHRGQQSAGLAICNDEDISCYKDMGFVSEVLDEKILNLLKGSMALGHVKYGPESESLQICAQPLVISYRNGSLAVAFNGALLNGKKLREDMEDNGAIFSTKTDCEVVTSLIAKNDKNNITEAVKTMMDKVKGGYAIGIMTGTAIIGVRDPMGIRPLALGKINDGFALASESCAFDMMEGEFIRDVRPGEILLIENNEITSIDIKSDTKSALCSFEYVYFARPDSTIDGLNVYNVREMAGKTLAVENPVKADIVVGVPDAGTPAAIGFSLGSGIPYRPGLIKNKYIGRTFIQPTQSQREIDVRIKLNPIKPMIEGKSVVLVDDSIVRGTTMRQIIASIRGVGAKEVHLRINSPPIRNSCYFGVNTPDINDFIANANTIDGIREELGADSLGFLSIEGLMQSLGGSSYCSGCFSGNYPIEV